jgi:hypothetical protein
MTETTDPREGGAWIGQHPDENTEDVREQLPDDAERVSVTNTSVEEAGSVTDEMDRNEDDQGADGGRQA